MISKPVKDRCCLKCGKHPHFLSKRYCLEDGWLCGQCKEKYDEVISTYDITLPTITYSELVELESELKETKEIQRKERLKNVKRIGLIVACSLVGIGIVNTLANQIHLSDSSNETRHYGIESGRNDESLTDEGFEEVFCIINSEICIESGETYQLQVSTNNTCTWFSSDNTIVVVDNTGLVTAVGESFENDLSAIVTAENELGDEAICSVVVKKSQVETSLENLSEESNGSDINASEMQRSTSANTSQNAYNAYEDVIEEETNKNEQVVYVTETGKKYHSRSSCPGLSNAKAIYKTTIDSARRSGLGACSKCW